MIRRPLMFACILAVCATAHAQSTTASIKIGVLDFQAVTERSTTIQALIRQAEAPLSDSQDAIDAKSAELQRRTQQLATNRSVLSAEAAAAEEQALAKLGEDVQDMQYELSKKVDRLDAEVMQPAVDRIVGVVKAVAREEGYDLVIPSEVALYFSDKIDLTPIVIQRLDRQAAAGAAAGAVVPALPSDQP